MSLYSYDKIYRSIIYFISQIVPAGVYVTDGESYGIRFDDPTGKSPSIAINIEESTDLPIELGACSTRFSTVFTISAVSRIQRDALKSIVHSGLTMGEIPIYSDFNGFIPMSGALIERFCRIGDYFKLRDMPNFDSDRERFFWNAVCFVSLDILGM